MSSLKKCLFRSSAHCFYVIACFFNILTYVSHLCILEIKPLPTASFANIFSHSVDCLSVLFMVFFAVEKFITLIRFCLFIFAFALVD